MKTGSESGQAGIKEDFVGAAPCGRPHGGNHGGLPLQFVIIFLQTCF
jgi:hypothetical protein